MSDVIHSAGRLMFFADELDKISKQLVEAEKEIERIEPLIEDSIEDFIAGLYEACEKDEKRLPPQDVRERLAQKNLPADLKLSYRQWLATRRRCKSRLSDLREIVAAHRSIVSAAKTEMEATEGPQPQWSHG